MYVERLSECPACDYDLRGLPIDHRCPECGFYFDNNTHVWRPGVHRATYWIICILSLVVLLGLCIQFSIPRQNRVARHAVFSQSS